MFDLYQKSAGRGLLEAKPSIVEKEDTAMPTTGKMQSETKCKGAVDLATETYNPTNSVKTIGKKHSQLDSKSRHKKRAQEEVQNRPAEEDHRIEKFQSCLL